ncbi:MAG TPA: tRNA pseudouridine(55) synthase TruB [Pyrinomonadaceae bacterium]|jgi:tRNA pseudouridine55 synthase
MDGILIIDKPAGLTSHDVVARVRRILRERRAGHTGTLDPFATGVLVMLLGRATRLAQFLSAADKEYEALIRFGYATETGDATGAVRGRAEDGPMVQPVPDWSEREIEAALASLRGEIAQVPPMYSAKKVKGEKLYEMARRGAEVERAAVRVKIHELEALRREDGSLLARNEDGTFDLGVRVVCSAGTYVRTLAESVGEHLGVGAHLAALRRERAGEFSLQGAVTLEGLAEQAVSGDAERAIVSLNAALSWMPAAHLTSEEARRARHGMAVRLADEKYEDGQRVRMMDERGDFLAVALYEAEAGSLRPRVVLAPEK